MVSNIFARSQSSNLHPVQVISHPIEVVHKNETDLTEHDFENLMQAKCGGSHAANNCSSGNAKHCFMCKKSSLFGKYYKNHFILSKYQAGYFSPGEKHPGSVRYQNLKIFGQQYNFPAAKGEKNFMKFFGAIS